MAQPTKDTWKNIVADYEKKWQFYNCLRAIDGKHISIRKPLQSGSFFNYKKDFSIVLLATVDANYRFTNVDVGSMGRFSDGNIFANSSLDKLLSSESMDLHEPKRCPRQDTPTSYVFIVDETFPLFDTTFS